jgi:two-component system NtrC family sensor kinase
LVVDDEQRLRGILTEAFSTLGHQVESVATGQEAIASLEQQAFDLIALDLRLPDIDGKEVWRWLQSHHPALASRVVFMTGDTMSPESEKFLQEAGQPVLNKPMTLEKIRRVVSQVLTTKPSDAG